VLYSARITGMVVFDPKTVPCYNKCRTRGWTRSKADPGIDPRGDYPAEYEGIILFPLALIVSLIILATVVISREAFVMALESMIPYPPLPYR
jgi:hypothetical protein